MFKPWKPIIQTLFFRKPVQTVSKHQLRNNRKLNLLTGRLKPCLKISLFIVIHLKWPEIDGLLRNRELREKESTPIDVIYQFNKFRTLGTDFTL